MSDIKLPEITAFKKFAWGLHWDTAFLRSCASVGFKSLKEAVEDGWAGKTAPSVIEVRNKHADQMTIEQFLDLKRWPLNEDALNDATSVYEDWLWQMAYILIEHTPEEGEVSDYSNIDVSLQNMVLWQVTCDSQRAEFKANMQDWDRKEKLTLEQIRNRCHPHLTGGKCSFKEHPDYPEES